MFIHIDFMCLGNICRSPMAELIFRTAVENSELREVVMVTSCGIGDWHTGNPPDKRALAELEAHGYKGGKNLRASQFSPFDAAADLLVALDTSHRKYLLEQGIPAEKVKLLRDFDPQSPPNSSVEDPYYGGPEGFSDTRSQIEAAVPGLLAWARSQHEANSKH
ncbi:low molecular weight protein-tyrosine-phosphatase [Corynebacterium caspium]|uniref:low molecular weight protein-tyrosine-phosphatase n=1 Tax=Corynebacterium caspium TaxID=234828 RepID=UPI00036F6825|nr:low molecular weight protein-tyrosine-phosphatase [Corynebacterium caspium]WKD59669.1 putative low molecular weight protein-tyrosine-phosphatase [Corynebacterium caspium DSM 44850]